MSNLPFINLSQFGIILSALFLIMTFLQYKDTPTLASFDNSNNPEIEKCDI